MHAPVAFCPIAWLATICAIQAQELPILENLEVSIPGDLDEKGKKHLYGIKVKESKKGDEWTVMHRYNDFSELRAKLVVTDPDVDDIVNVPFPGAVWFMNEEKMAERLAGLDKWLQGALKMSKLKQAWKPALKEFLKVDSQVGTSIKDKIGAAVDGAVASAKETAASVAEKAASVTDSIKKMVATDDNLDTLAEAKALLAEGSSAEGLSAEEQEGLAEIGQLVAAAEKIQAELELAKEAEEKDDENIKALEEKFNEAEAKAVEKAKAYSEKAAEKVANTEATSETGEANSEL
jgi:hypothetical protein